MAEMVTHKFVIPDEARPYLVLQQGNLDRWKHDTDLWDTAYNASINGKFREIAPFLPADCKLVLDVGSGLGGVNVLIHKHYGTVSIDLIDGYDNPPKHYRHDQAFNDMLVAQRFLAANGVDFISTVEDRGEKVDLVLSFAAWCFHFPPSLYLEEIKSFLSPGATLILEVRSDKPEWYAELAQAFGAGEMIFIAEKYTTWRFIYAG